MEFARPYFFDRVRDDRKIARNIESKQDFELFQIRKKFQSRRRPFKIHQLSKILEKSSRFKKKKISIPANSAKIKTFTLLSLPRSPAEQRLFPTVVSSASSNSIFFNRLTTDDGSPLLVVAEAQKEKKKKEKERKKRKGIRWKEIQTVVKRELASQREFASHRSRGDKSGLYQGVQ